MQWLVCVQICLALSDIVCERAYILGVEVRPCESDSSIPEHSAKCCFSGICIAINRVAYVLLNLTGPLHSCVNFALTWGYTLLVHDTSAAYYLPILISNIWSKVRVINEWSPPVCLHQGSSSQSGLSDHLETSTISWDRNLAGKTVDHLELLLRNEPTPLTTHQDGQFYQARNWSPAATTIVQHE